jgi:hypothetical protein
MTTALPDIVDLYRYPLHQPALRETCRETLARDGALVMRGFLTPAAIASVRGDGERKQHLAYFCTQEHNVYLTPPDPAFADDHTRNRTVVSSKGCITDDQISQTSPLRTLYQAPVFRDFLCAVLGETSLHPYADRLSSINLHYARPGQELGWHFDNSSFATTLMIQEPEHGGVFEFVAALRDASAGDHGFDNVRKVLDGETEQQTLAMDAGALVLFRGRNALHRVTPVAGNRTRILVVLAYNAEPGVCLSESARMTFYGRLQ